MKKWISFILIAVLLFSLAGCRAAEPSEEDALAGEFVESETENQPEEQPEEQAEQKPSEEQAPQEEQKPAEKPQEEQAPQEEQKPAEKPQEEQKPEQTPQEETPEEQEPEKQEPEANLTLMSFNVRNNDDPNGHSRAERMPRVQKIIETYQPDIVGTMELKPAWEEYFKTSYPDYGFFLHYRETDGRPNREGLGILYNKATVELIEEDFFWLSETPDQPSIGWGGDYVRILVWGKFRHKETGKEFLYADVHMNGNEEFHEGAFNMIKTLFDKNADIPCFLGGDFNIKVNSQGYLLYSGYLDQARTIVSRPTSDASTLTLPLGYPQVKEYNHIDEMHVIDYLFHQEDKTPAVDYIVHDKLVDGYYASDHFPVIGKYIIGGEE